MSNRSGYPAPRSYMKGEAAPPPVINNYDPQMTAVAQQNTDLAREEQDFTHNYYNQYVTPALKQQQDIATASDARLQQLSDAELESMKVAQQQQTDIYNAQKAQMDLANQRYQQYGIPAEDAYYKMAKDYSAPEEEQRQAGLALGDVSTAAEGARGNMMRTMAGYGVDPSSPAAISAMSDMAVQNAAAGAAASTRARGAAKTLGMSLTSDAANFGRGGQSQAMNLGNSASGASTGGSNASAAVGGASGSMASGAFGVASGNVTGTNAGASVPMSGYAGAANMYGINTNAWSGLGSASIAGNASQYKSWNDRQAQESAGLGNFLGSAMGMGTKLMTMSDVRLKTNIEHVGHVRVGGQPLKVYDFEYTYQPGVTHRGVMAQEVLHVRPSAVVTRPDGYMAVDYSQLED